MFSNANPVQPKKKKKKKWHGSHHQWPISRCPGTVSAYNSLSQPVKALAHWLSMAGVSLWTGICPPHWLPAFKIKQTFLSISLVFLLAFEWQTARLTPLSVTKLWRCLFLAHIPALIGKHQGCRLLSSSNYVSLKVSLGVIFILTSRKRGKIREECIWVALMGQNWVSLLFMLHLLELSWSHRLSQEAGGLI